MSGEGEAPPLELARPEIGPREEELVLAVLRSGRLSLGPMGDRFERELPFFCELADLSAFAVRMVLSQARPGQRQARLLLQTRAEREAHLLHALGLVLAEDALAPDLAAHGDERLDHGFAHVAGVLDARVGGLDRGEEALAQSPLRPLGSGRSESCPRRA